MTLLLGLFTLICTLMMSADTAAAVRKASLRTIEEDRNAGRSTDPFFWAGFVAAGDWR